MPSPAEITTDMFRIRKQKTLMRLIVAMLTMYGMSLETAPISAKLNCDALWNGNESPRE